MHLSYYTSLLEFVFFHASNSKRQRCVMSSAMLLLATFERVFRGNCGVLIWQFAQSEDPFLRVPEPWLEKQLRLSHGTAAGQWEVLKKSWGCTFDVEQAGAPWSRFDFLVAMRESVFCQAIYLRPRVVSDHVLSLPDFLFECWLLGDECAHQWGC